MHLSDKLRGMEDERISRALARIEAAAQRVEAAVAGVTASNPDSGLMQRHELLKREASAALSVMDSLIRTLEQ